jgi:hypothetical protein
MPIDFNLRAYRQGWHDAIAAMLQQLRNESTDWPQGGYTGPLPLELEQWLANVESKLGQAPR